MRASLRKSLLVVAGVLLIWTTGVMAQMKLSDLVSEGGFDWMIGRWGHETDGGDKLQIIYKWELDKHMISMHFKMPNYEYRGMIFYKPVDNEVVQIGVDNRGGSSKAIWDTDGERAISKSEHTEANGEIRRFGVAHSKVDAETMKAEVYGLDSDGNLDEQPGFTIEYKRQKPQVSKKDSAEAP
jgi:hypothetical protein